MKLYVKLTTHYSVYNVKNDKHYSSLFYASPALWVFTFYHALQDFESVDEVLQRMHEIAFRLSVYHKNGSEKVDVMLHKTSLNVCLHDDLSF